MQKPYAYRLSNDLNSCCSVDHCRQNQLDTLTELAAQSCAADLALISLVDDKKQYFASRFGDGFELTSTPREHAFCAHVVDANGPLVVFDARRDPRFSDNPLVQGFPFIRSYAGVPLWTPDGKPVGAACVIHRKPIALQNSHLTQLRLIADFAMRQLNDNFAPAPRNLSASCQ